MGIYLNPGNDLFWAAKNSEIYVDKSGLISYTNKVLGSEQRFICVSRPRRFGKSMTANMLTAYYSNGCDSAALFDDLEISSDKSYKIHLNKYDVMHFDIQWFLSASANAGDMINLLQREVVRELHNCYPEDIDENIDNLALALSRLYGKYRKQFVFIIDEWDCIFREDQYDHSAQKAYLDFLRGLLKGPAYVKLVYMTGILPIKKYGSHSALNMFDEYSMTNPGELARYVGFTESEVRQLCIRYDMDFEETKRWYDGYHFKKYPHIYNPKSVVDAMRRREFDSYWTQTETYEALKIYIDMNFDGLKDDIVMMLGGGRCKINPRTFQNDMTDFKCKDDVLTLLIHLGYLSYDIVEKEVCIPNSEVEAEFANAIEGAGWKEIIKAFSASEKLLKETINKNSDFVEKSIQEMHMETSILSYNDENALSCVISLAYYSARNYYSIIRELPSGKGFADLVFVPYKRYVEMPAMIIELKWDKSAYTAIEQIKEKDYVQGLKGYKGKVLLVGISYDKKSKQHQCVIEDVIRA